MKRLIITFLFLSSFFNHGYSQDKEYEIPDINVQVEILESGIVRIIEHRTYLFEGSFSWADYRLPKNGFSEIQNIRVSENDDGFINENNENAGTFSVSENDDSIIIAWHFDAENENRTFSVSYELTDALSIGPDWTEFFWNYIASGREKPTENLNINISLPEKISEDSLYAWTRPPSLEVDSDKNTDSFSISAKDLSTDQSLQVRSVFPTRIFDESQISITDSDLTLEWIQNDEQAYISEQQQIQERNEYYNSITPEVTILICVISLAVFILLYRKYGTRFPTGTISDRETILIPDSTPPAIVGQLMTHGYPSGRHLAATIFDLARRGWFTIDEGKKEKNGFFSSDETQFRIKKFDPQPEKSLPLWEKMIVDHINQQIDEGIDRFDKVFKEGDFDMSTWFNEWKEELKKVFDEKNWIDKESTKGVVLNIILQIILLVISVVLIVLGSADVAFIALICTGLMTGASAVIKRRTREGKEKYKRWKAYRNGLKNADKRTIRMEMMDRHFIYAVALSLSAKQIEKVVKKAEHGDEIIFAWIVLMSGSNHTPASVASTVTTLVATSTSTFSGTSGGVGASAGAAGGGASGGAG